MRLFPDDHQRLDAIDDTLRDEAPRLAAKFDMFARLTHGEGEPPSEQRFRPARTWRDRLSAWWWRWSRPLRRIRAMNGPVRA